MGVAQPINDDPQTTAGNVVDQVVHQVLNMVEQPARQHDPHGNVELTLRRSTRGRRSVIPDDYIVYLQELDDDFGVKIDLITFSQTMNCNESDLWFNEMNSMATNGVWDLVKFHNGTKTIGCKWVYKTKKDLSGNIERYKARLVAKGLTQKEEIDYNETFSPISKKDSLHIILALVAHFDFELQQMYVKTTFLNRKRYT